jgi:hypothetical protein
MTDRIITHFQGFPVVVENPLGTVRSGVNDAGDEWEREMKADYGYIPGTENQSEGDGEDLDVYLGPDPKATEAYLIEQLDDEGNLDEYKCMLGYSSKDKSVRSYLEHYPSGWELHIGEVWATSIDKLREILYAHWGKE